MAAPSASRRLGLALLLGAALAACSDDSPSETPAPTPTPVPTVTETFSGAFGQGENVVHNFTVANDGDVEVEITRLEPLPTMQVGVGIGTIDETLSPPCSLFAQDNNVRLNDVFLSSDLAAGDYCIEVLDVGNVFPGVSVSYDVDVTHP